MSFDREGLKRSAEAVGQIYPVLVDRRGRIIDGFHRKRVDPNWKEERLDVEDPLDVLRIRVHAQYRRRVPESEKREWVRECRRILQSRGKRGTQREIAEALGMRRQWVSEYDTDPVQPHENIQKDVKLPDSGNLTRSCVIRNVWGLEDGGVAACDPEQPDAEYIHGVTPSFVIENLLDLYGPRRVLDSMAGVGSTGWVCSRRGVECDQFDVYPWPKGGVLKGDAEDPPVAGRYDLIFNHVPYLGMVRYGDDPEDLSNMPLAGFLAKMRRVFLRNRGLLEDGGVYAVLVGDWRHGGRIVPLTAHITMLGLECGFILFDEAVKLTAEQKGGRLQIYRAAEGGYMPQGYDTVLIFKKGGGGDV